MKTSPFFMGIIYLTMGILFTFLAIETAQETVWNFLTLLLIAVATFDYTTAFRFFWFSNQIKKAKQKQNKK